MNKKIAVLLAFFIGLIFYAPVKAAEQILFLDNGGYNTATNELVILCFNVTECYDVHTMQRIGDVATKVDTTNAKVDQLNQKIDQLQNTVNQLQTPVVQQPVQSPVVSGAPQAPTILPAYTENDLAHKLGVWRNQDVAGTIKVYFLNFQCSAESATTANCSGSGIGSEQITFQFNGQTVNDCSKPFCGSPLDASQQWTPSITGLTPNTTYSYTITYTEAGREDSVFTKSFHTPGN